MNRLWAGRLVVSLALGLLCAIPAPATAGTQDGAVVALHAAPHSVKGEPCASQYEPVAAGILCRDFTTSWPLNTPCDLYLVVA